MCEKVFMSLGVCSKENMDRIIIQIMMMADLKTQKVMCELILWHLAMIG